MAASSIFGRLLLTGVVLAMATGGAVAQGGPGPAVRPAGARMQQRFAAADKNGDGRLSLQEAQAGMPFVAKHFAEIDRQKSGFVTLADIAAFARARRAAKRAQN